MYTGFATFLFQTPETQMRALPRLQVRFLPRPGVEDDLVPPPLDVRGAPFPAIVSMTAFSVDDSGAQQDPMEIALSLEDPDNPGDAPLFRSGVLSALPTPRPADPNGFLSVAVPDPVTFTVAELNAMAGARFGAGPMTAGPVALTGATITAPPGGGLLLTVTGSAPPALPTPTAPTGGPPSLPPPPPPPALTGLTLVTFVYTATLGIDPIANAYQADRIVQATTSGPTLTFFAVPGSNPVIGATSPYVAGFLNLVSPVIQDLVREEIHERLSRALDTAIRDAAMATAGSAGAPAPASATITIQRLTVSSAGITARATLGAIGPLVPPSTGSGCAGALPRAGVLFLGAALRGLFS